MKKFFVVFFGLILIISTRLYAQPGMFRLSTIDSTNLMSVSGLQTIKSLCHAVPEIVLQNMKYERIKKYKSDRWYTYYYADGKTDVHAPVKGELMLSYEGKYFYSVTEHAFVAKYSNPYVVSEKKVKNKEVLTTIINSPAGQAAIATGNEMIRREVVKILNPQ